MATSMLIPLSQYLGHSFRPDCDYIDGELQERNLGELDHSDLQKRLMALLDAPKNSPYLRVNQELRVQVKATRFRVPDVCVMRKTAPREQVVRTAPLLCIEVLSPEDTMPRIRERIRDYFEMGVPEAWIIDPASRTATICRGDGEILVSEGTLSVPETPVVIALADVFKVLDEYD